MQVTKNISAKLVSAALLVACLALLVSAWIPDLAKQNGPTDRRDTNSVASDAQPAKGQVAAEGATRTQPREPATESSLEPAPSVVPDARALSVKVPLDDLIQAAARSSDMEEVHVAVYAASICKTVRSNLPALQTREEFRLVYSDLAFADRLRAEAVSARQELQRYCAASKMDLEAFTEEYRRRGGSMAKGLVTDWPVGSPEWIEKRQRVIQVLGNSRKYSTALNSWLIGSVEKEALTSAPLSFEQWALVRDHLFTDLTESNQGPDSLRALVLCGYYGNWCPSAVAAISPRDRETALNEARRLAELIRQQRFDEVLRSRAP